MEALLTALQNPALYDHPVRDFQLIETHISWVLLTGDYAYKIKKPVNLGFLDFSTLEKRRFYCQEELRLNKRLAPHIYLDVVALTGSPQQPVLNGSGSAFEYAVKMKQFAQSAQMDRMLAAGELTLQHMDQLAQRVAQFHAKIAVADNSSPQGSLANIRAPVDENFDQIRSLISPDTGKTVLQKLAQWCETEFKCREPDFLTRKANGFIRECHGDMHLRNIAVDSSDIIIFDCIEFSDDLRWNDVMSEIAFVVMDLHDRQQPAMAARFLNRYLEYTGDYAGLSVLRYYLVYRAMVRAKVDCIRAHQPGLSQQQTQPILQEFHGYLELASHYTQVPRPYLVITHGLSGAGKTWYTQALLEATGMIRIRSDIERKRLFGLTATSASGSGVQDGIYTPSASQQTYAHLQTLTGTLLERGWPVIVDATFLHGKDRAAFAQLAEQRHVPFVILSFQANISTLKQRIQSRSATRSDASEATVAVLEHQLTSQEPLTAMEQTRCITVDTEAIADPATACAHIQSRLAHFVQTP